MKKIFIVGATQFAELVALYMNNSGRYEVVGFAVEQKYLAVDRLGNLPVIPFEHAEDHFLTQDVEFFAAIGYKRLNAVRSRLYEESKKKGYAPASYMGDHTIIGPGASLGEHIFLFENVVIQARTMLEENTIVCASSFIGHDCCVSKNCFIAAGAVLGGNVRVGDNCFIGMNATVLDGISIADHCVVGAGARVDRDIMPNTVVKPSEGVVVSQVKGIQYLWG